MVTGSYKKKWYVNSQNRCIVEGDPLYNVYGKFII